jgi:glycosyltransferase involved in cell wall biosynthesis
MKIAIAVHGRFHGFDLARALIARGHEVGVFTNYPRWAARRFELPEGCVHSYLSHSLASRLAAKASRFLPVPDSEPMLHKMFGRWAARAIREHCWDVIHAFSGVAEELLLSPRRPGEHRSIVRGSSHISMQDRLLREEERRSGSPIARPSAWMIARERREYELADSIAVLSTFALESFVAEGVPREKLLLLPLGVDVTRFRPSPEVVSERRRRILGGAPLRVLFVGTASFQKGILDFAEIVRALSGPRFQFRFLGDTPAESAAILRDLRGQVEIIGRQPQFELPRWYDWADVFLFPTIQDGFAIVLSQAQAGALPVLATTNCSAHDMIREGETGWVLPIRRPREFVERLVWIESNRGDLASMVDRLYREFTPRDWNDVARDFEAFYSGSAPAPPMADAPLVK